MPASVLTDTDFGALPMGRAAKILKTKTTLPSALFDGLSREAKTRAFRIAGVSRLSLLEKVKNLLAKGQREGKSLSDLKNEIRQAFKAAGVKPLQEWHLRTVVRQNMLGAAATARDRVLRDPVVKRAFPFWQYMTVGNGKPGVSNVRDEHMVLHGKVFLAADPFWRIWTPPNGYNCRCFIIPLTEEMFAATKTPLYKMDSAGSVVRSDGKGKPTPLEMDPQFAVSADEDVSSIALTGLLSNEFQELARKIIDEGTGATAA